jgi:hypothetical protein
MNGRTPSRRLKSATLAGLVVLTATVLVCVQSAAAQPPGGGPIHVGGTVPSFLGLGVTQPTGLGIFPHAATVHSYTTSFKAVVTSTDARAQLTVTDQGQYGHLTSGASVLAQPLEIAASGSRFVSLSAPNGVLLKRWTGPIAGQATVIHLLQRITSPPAVTGPYATALLITVASGTP